MNQEVLNRALEWADQLIKRNNGVMPDWPSYVNSLRQYLHAPPSAAFKVPHEYEYVYLRGKGLTDSEIRVRMNIGADVAAEPPKKRRRFLRRFF
ncbi:MAG TPA: hypothetical protein VEC06_01775 [Paucimonas sp.]|nr:hypothetical protein [Paucimonas sp.]